MAYYNIRSYAAQVPVASACASRVGLLLRTVVGLGGSGARAWTLGHLIVLGAYGGVCMFLYGGVCAWRCVCIEVWMRGGVYNCMEVCVCVCVCVLVYEENVWVGVCSCVEA